MRIGELGRRTGVNTHQLRYYEAQGLLEADRGANGYREYDERAVLRVRQIRHLLGAGLSSEDIAYVLPCAVGEAPQLPGCPEWLAAMRSRLQRLDEQMERLARSRDALVDYIDAAGRTGSESHPPFDDADPEPVSIVPGRERSPLI
ncbi:MerR family transcriptional regulator [Streptomyces noursei]|uniref:MerR family transcriptional regulator n=1 Tax=Streptomyces noursei TaxID=1971 RepID=UPI00081C9C12|nr:transcriptional regulator [Streptomyces noursei ATCC 11455]MCZ0995577.1 MerR family transcriptional regulator [Streptomyces noursei]